MRCRFVYSPDYDFSLCGLERLHPFDARRASRAWSVFRAKNPAAATQAWLRPTDPVTDDELAQVHTRDYLRSLGSSAVVARALDALAARGIPMVVTASGGYTGSSHALIAQLATYLASGQG